MFLRNVAKLLHARHTYEVLASYICYLIHTLNDHSIHLIIQSEIM